MYCPPFKTEQSLIGSLPISYLQFGPGCSFNASWHKARIFLLSLSMLLQVSSPVFALRTGVENCYILNFSLLDCHSNNFGCLKSQTVVYITKSCSMKVKCIRIHLKNDIQFQYPTTLWSFDIQRNC